MKYLLDAGVALLIRGKTVQPGQVVEVPPNLFAAFSAGVQARLSESIEDADVDVTAYEIAGAAETESAVSADPVVANGISLTAGDWEDVFAIDGTGTALAVIESAGDGLHFGPGAASSRYGARLAGTLGAGNQLIAFTFAMGRRTDIATSLQIAAKVGISPGGLDDPQNAEWYAAGIDGIARDIYGSALTAWKNGSLTTAWTGEAKGATRTFAGGISGTFAIERTGTDITIWLIRAGVRQQIETYAGAAITAGDVFVHIESPSSGSHMVLLALATSGLAWDGERLVSAA